MRTLKVLSLIIALGMTLNVAIAADAQRQRAVAERGADVMPFDLKATTHIFTKTPKGGVQQVITKQVDDAAQIRLTRAHLKSIADEFSRGDFSGPTHIHGMDMPGLAELKQAKPGEIKIQYREVKAGAELSYSTENPVLVTALHRWFDAQLSDHGSDAMEGHDHAHVHHPQ